MVVHRCLTNSKTLKKAIRKATRLSCAIARHICLQERCGSRAVVSRVVSNDRLLEMTFIKVGNVFGKKTWPRHICLAGHGADHVQDVQRAGREIHAQDVERAATLQRSKPIWLMLGMTPKRGAFSETAWLFWARPCEV